MYAQLFIISSFVFHRADMLQPESEIGGFDRTLLDQFDDTLAAIHHISEGMYYATLIEPSLITLNRQDQGHHRTARCPCTSRIQRCAMRRLLQAYRWCFLGLLQQP